MTKQMMTEEDLFLELSKLSATEIERAQAHLLALSKLGPVRKSSKSDEFTSELYSAISGQLFKRTRTKQMPFGTFSRTPTYQKRFLAASNVVRAVNLQWFPKQTRVQRSVMFNLYAQLVLDYIDLQDSLDAKRHYEVVRGEERVDARPVLAIWFRISSYFVILPEIVDKAFPGYIANGLLDKVIESLTRNI